MKIPIKVYEEIKSDILDFTRVIYYARRLGVLAEYDFEWLDNNGINTPYLVTIINGEK